jgi:hypothetical protein
MVLVATGTPDPQKDPFKGRPLGRILIKLGKLNRELLHQALGTQAEMKARRNSYVPLGEILLQLEFLSRPDIELALRLQNGLPPPENN